MAFSISIVQIIPKGKKSYPRSQKTPWRMTGFLYDADLRHVESSVQCHRKYKNRRIKVDLG